MHIVVCFVICYYLAPGLCFLFFVLTRLLFLTAGIFLPVYCIKRLELSPIR
jgi:hypothetical protein